MPFENLVFVTGASRGLGLALAENVPWESTRVVGFGRSAAPSFHARLPGVALEYVWVNLASSDGVNVVSQTLDRELQAFSGQRVLFFNNAGTLRPIGPAHRVDSSAYDDALTLGALTPLRIGQRFLQAVAGREDRQSWLVNISSGAAHAPYAGWSAYCAGKAAVDQWTRCVALELARMPCATRVYAVAPGVLDTAMQLAIRSTPATDFPEVAKFKELHSQGQLTAPAEAAKRIYRFLLLPPGQASVVDLRDFPQL